MKVKCNICGREFLQITANHLKTHNTTRLEYISLYGQEGVQNTTNVVTHSLFQPEADNYAIKRHLKIQKLMNK